MMSRLAALLQLLALDRLPRTGWLLAGVPAPESVAAHSLGTALVVLALGPRLEPALDLDHAVALAVVHDVPEALLGDLPRRASELVGVDAKRTAERRAAEELLRPLSGAALERFEEVGGAQTRSARFVRLCDKLHLGLRLLGYARAGSRGLEEFRRGLEALDCTGFAPCEELRGEILTALDGAPESNRRADGSGSLGAP